MGTIIAIFRFYGYETWSVALRTQHWLFEGRVGGRGMLGPKKDEVTGMWRKQHNGELHGLYCLPNIGLIKLRRMRSAVLVVRIS